MKLISILILLLSIQTVFAQKHTDKVTGYLRSKKYQAALDYISAKKAELTYQSDEKQRLKNIIELNILEGDVYLKQTNYLKAEKAYDEGIKNLEEKKISYDKLIRSYEIDVLDRQANLNLILGDYLTSGELLSYSDSLRKTLGKKKNNKLSQHKYVFGKYHYLVNEYGPAKECFFDYINAVLGKNYSNKQLYTVSSCYNYLAEISLSEHKPWDAERYAKKSFRISQIRYARKKVDNPYEELIKSYDNLSKSRLVIGDIKKAKEYSDEGLKVYIEHYNDSTIDFISLWLTRAEIMWQSGLKEQAHKNFKIANKIQLEYISQTLPNLGEQAKENFYRDISRNMNMYFAFCSELVEETDDYLAKTRLLKEMLAVRVNTKGKILSESNKMIEYVQRSNDPEIRQIYELLKSRKEELSINIGQGKSNLSLNPLRTEINGYEETLTQLLKEEGVKFTTKLTKVSEIPGRMATNSSAIEIFRLPKHVPYKHLKNKDLRKYKKSDSLQLASSLSFENPEYFFIKLNHKSELTYASIKDGKQLENEGVSLYHKMIKYRIEDKKSFNSFLGPITHWIDESDLVYLSSDGAYNQINISVLQDVNSGKFLIEGTNVYNINNLDEITSNENNNIAIETAMLIGRPDYSLVNTYVSDSTVAYVSTRGIEDFHNQQISDLPGTEKEINTIAEILAQNESVNVESYLHEKATERIIKDHASYNILHISTHGFFIENSSEENINPMMRSGLLLAGVSDYDGQQDDDGILTAYEASNIDLKNTQLVVLSACETGLGEVKDGEGVYGLQRAFQIAGVKYILMSMWKVDDEATSLLMTSFYNNLSQTNDVPGSFKKAQMELQSKYKQPYYWGAFKLIGN